MAGPAGLPAESALQITHRISKKGAASSLSLTAESLGTGMQGPHIAIADRRMDYSSAKKTGASRVESAKANDSESVAFEYPVQE